MKDYPDETDFQLNYLRRDRRLKFKYPIKDADFIITKDELAYQEILEDFNNTEYILILTYNISANKDKLIDKNLKNLKETTTVDILTNIPSRYEGYYGIGPKNRARKTVNIYLTKLDPANYDSTLNTYFIFENHAKIIMTDNIIFIGSSNFSDESADNFESGIISRDKEFILYIKNEIVPILKRKAEHYYKNDSINSSRIKYKHIYYRLVSVIEDVRLSFYSSGDAHGHFFEYFDPINNRHHINDNLNRLNHAFVEFSNIMREILNDLEDAEVDTESIENIVDNFQIEEIELMYSDDTEIYNFLNFDNQQYAMDYINEYEIDVDLDDIDNFRESASQVAYDEETNLEEIAKPHIEDFLRKLSNLKKQLEEVLNEISININENIDNT